MITKKEDLYGTKIRTNGRNKEILERLKEIGCKDLIGEHDVGMFMDGKYVYLDKTWGEGELNWTRDSEEDYFRKHENREITVEELLDMKETVVVSKEFVLEAHKEACSEWRKKIEKELPELFPKTTYRTGQRFMDVSRNIEYILARAVDKEVILVNLIDGNRYSDSVPVGNVKVITESEWRKITNGDHKDFKLIG